MASKKINKSDIAPKDIFANVTDGAKEAKIQIDLLTKSVKALKTNATNIKKDLPKSNPKTTKGMKDFNELQRKSNANSKAKLQIDKQLLHHKAKLSQLQRDENKAIKTTIESQAKLSRTQQKNLGTLQKLALSNRKLRAERAKLNLDTKKGISSLKKINAQLDKNNSRIKDSGDAMKKQRLNVGNYGVAVNKLRNTLENLGISLGVFTLLKGAFNIVKDFDQSQANLASVLGKSTDEMEALTNQAKLLGSTTTFTASQVASLHLELAKLGFSEGDIEGMTTATLALAEATGSELGETASVVGATMRGFNLDVSETKRVTDVMAKSFTSSSLDMSKFSQAMSTVAPVANLAEVSLERTTAMLGTLTDRGLDAGTAGTGLRNMFLQANKHGLTFAEAMDKVKNSTDQTATSMDLFGTRGATIGVILANNENAIDGLTTKLLDADGASQKMADTQRDTLGGAIKLLQSAWEGLVLKFEEGTGTFGMLKDAIVFLADNLEILVKGFTVLATVFGMYSLIDKTAKAWKLLNLAMKANPFILLASILAGVIIALKLFSDEMTDAEKATEKMAETNKKLKEEQDADTKSLADKTAGFISLTTQLSLTNAGSKERIKLIKKINDKYGTTIQNIKDEKKFQDQLNVSIGDYIAKQKTKIALKRKDAEITDLVNTVLDAEEKLQAIQDRITKIANHTGRGRGTVVGDLDLAKDISHYKSIIDKANKELKILAEKALVIQHKIDEDGGGDKDEPDNDKEEITSLLRKIEDGKVKLMAEAENREIKATDLKFQRLIEDTKKKKTNEKEFIEWEKIQLDLLQVEKGNILKKYEEKREKLRQNNVLSIIKNSITEKQIELNKVADIYENYEEIENLKKEIDEEKIKLIKKKAEFDVSVTGLSEEKKLEIITKSEKAISDIRIGEEKRVEKHNLEARNRMNDEYTRLENEKLLTLLKSNASQEEIEERMLDFQIEQLKEKIAEYKKLYPEMAEEITEMEIALENKKRKRDEEKVQDEIKKEIEGDKTMAKLRQDSISAMTDLFIKKADERIAKLNEEMSAHQKQADFLKQLAINGNIEAKDSLAEENRLIAEAEMKKEQEEKRKQQILMVSAVLKSYIANIDAGQPSGEALGNAIASKEVLDQFISGIGSFYEGTEDTGTVSNGLDSNGGRIALLHNNERVLTAKQNNKIGNYTNDQVANIVEQNRFGNLSNNSQVGNSWESQLVVEELLNVGNKLDAVNKTILNKEVTSVEMGAITQTAMSIVESRKKAGNRTISTYKVRI